MTSPDQNKLAATAAPDELAARRAEAEPSSAPPRGDGAQPGATPDDEQRSEEDRDASDERLPGSPDVAWADEKPQHQTDG